MIQYDKSYVEKKLRNKYASINEQGKIEDIVISRKSDHENFSRITQFRIVGSEGKSISIRGEDLRLTIDPSGLKLKSTIFNLIDSGDKWTFQAGRGFGHGVGLCQCGAQAMARKANTARQILAYYYPSSDIKSIY